MKKQFTLNFFNTYSDAEWIGIKIALSLMWLGIFRYTSINQDIILYPTGLCAFFDCSLLTSNYTFAVLIFIGVILAILYILEKWMPFTTFLMFFISLLIFTLEESNGILNRNSLYSMAFLAQFFAYYRNNNNNNNLKSERIQFPIQIIAAGYVLAGISKLKESGLNWITSAPQASIQILKNYCYAYFDTGQVHYLNHGMKLVNFTLENVLFIKIIFASSLFLELFAWIAIKNKQNALIYGLLLTAMHLGILYFMHIMIVSIFAPMIIFMVNPVGLFILLLTIFFQRPKSSIITTSL